MNKGREPRAKPSRHPNAPVAAMIRSRGMWRFVRNGGKALARRNGEKALLHSRTASVRVLKNNAKLVLCTAMQTTGPAYGAQLGCGMHNQRGEWYHIGAVTLPARSLSLSLSLSPRRRKLRAVGRRCPVRAQGWGTPNSPSYSSRTGPSSCYAPFTRTGSTSKASRTWNMIRNLIVAVAKLCQNERFLKGLY